MPDQFEVPPDAVFKAPWVSFCGEFDSFTDVEAVMLERERLVREFLKRRPDLSDAAPEVVAKRFDTNTVLIHFRKPDQVKQGGFSFAVVALSMNEAAMPEIAYFECWNHWEFEGMDRDAAEFVRAPDGE